MHIYSKLACVAIPSLEPHKQRSKKAQRERERYFSGTVGEPSWFILFSYSFMCMLMGSCSGLDC
jgi:hypothetical protein